MKKLPSKQKNWLVGFHVFFAGIWLGAGVCMVLVLLASNPDSGDAVHTVNAVLKLIDDFIIIPTAIGSLLTGLLISWLTNWGFFRFTWVTAKWILTVASILFGTFFLGPWLNGMEAISATERAMALHNEVYLHYRQMNTLFAPVQIASLVFMVFISVLKPWGKLRKG